MDGAEYRCVIRVGADECGEVVEQADMPHHLTATHRMKVTVDALMESFVLHRASTARTKGTRPSVPDQTEPMFDRGDFR